MRVGAALLGIVGPTASGKSDLAQRIAPGLGAQIVSIDSMQVYRGMDIGTAKPTPAQRRSVPHHMIDVVDPSHMLGVVEFRTMARSCIDEIVSSNSTALLVGGSGLYLRAVIDPLEFAGADLSIRRRLQEEAVESGGEAMHRRLRSVDARSASRIDERNVRRVIRALEVFELTGRPFSSFQEEWTRFDSIYNILIAGLLPAPEVLRDRIARRTDEMFERGLVQECEKLSRLRSGVTARKALGYAQVLDYLQGNTTLDEARLGTIMATQRYARRQMSWFRADPRIRWFTGDARELERDVSAYFHTVLPDALRPTA